MARAARAGLRRAGRLSSDEQLLRVLRAARRCSSARADRHQRRRSSGDSDCLNDDLTSAHAANACTIRPPSRELLQVLKIPRDERDRVQAALEALVADGRSDPDSRQPLRPARKDGPRASAGSTAIRRGFGFVAPERADRRADGDIYIAAEPQRSDARRPRRRPHRAHRKTAAPKGSIVQILERAATHRSSAATIVDALGPGLRRAVRSPRADRTSTCRRGEKRGAEPGEMVIVELTRWPTPTRGPVGRVIEVLGDIDEPGVDTEIIIRKYGIPDAHSAEAIAEAQRIGGAVKERDIAGRTDFRDRHGRHHRRRARARLRRCDHDRAAAERPLLARRAHRRRRRTTCTEGSALDREALRARHVGVLSRSAPCTCFRRSWRPGCAA